MLTGPNRQHTLGYTENTQYRKVYVHSLCGGSQNLHPGGDSDWYSPLVNGAAVRATLWWFIYLFIIEHARIRGLHPGVKSSQLKKGGNKKSQN